MRASKPVQVGLNLMPSEDFREATFALFDANQVEVLEWSFDMPFNGFRIAPWCQSLIEKYSAANLLLGHGVHLSLLSAKLSGRQQRWLAQTSEEFARHNYIHASEHFGFSEAGPVSYGAPLPVPMTKESLARGKEMIKRYADATGCPVGLENLALAFCLDDVKRQGEFIDQLINEVDGFLLLDLHNVYCQVVNFEISEFDLLNSYPLSKVTELHLSGGSWSPSMSSRRLMVRRDSHDDAVPQEVFNLAALALKLCPDTRYVILERLANTMPDSESQHQFCEDFAILKEIVAGAVHA